MEKHLACRQRLLLLFLAFCIPLGFLLIAMVGSGVAPFGDRSLLFLDSNSQYLSFLSYFRTILRGENNLFYSLSEGLGGNFFPLAGYYLLSPFHLLFLAASNGSMALGFHIVVLLKLSCCSVSFCYASSEVYGNRRILPVFSTAYALAAYNVIYCWNIMWLDGVIFLPLIGLGLWQIWTQGRYRLYFFSLLIALISNYYTGFMLCVAATLFSAALMLWTQDGKRSARENARILGRWLLCSLAAGFLAAVVWLPAVYPILTHRALKTGSGEPLLLFPVWDLFAKLVPGAIDYNEINNGLPNVFCTCAALFLSVCFFFDRSQPVGKRLSAGACVLFLLLSFSLRDLNHLWHCFSRNNSFNYRYSFVFSYLLLVLAQHQLLRGSFRRRQLLSALVIVLGMLTAVLCRRNDYGFLSPYSLPLAFAGLLVFAVLMLARYKRPSKGLLAALGAAILLEAGAGAYVTLSEMQIRIPFNTKMDDYYTRTDSVTAAVSTVRALDQGLYRTELFNNSYNDPLFFNYYGMSHFSSVLNDSLIRFLKEMGFQQNSIWSRYHRGSTAEAEAFLGLKYILTTQDLASQKQDEKLTEGGPLDIYRNPNALPLAMFADPSLLRLSPEEDALFGFHNQIWSALASRELSLLREEPGWQLKTENLAVAVNEDGYTVYTRLDPARDASVFIDLVISEDKPLYYYFSAPKLQNAELFLNGEDQGQYFWIYQWDMGCAGTFEPGEPLQLELRLMRDELCMGRPQFFYEDLALLSEVSAQVRAAAPSMVRESSSRFSGDFRAERDELLLFTIPYEDGWELRVDGEKTELIPALDALLAAEVPAGEHSFSLRFVPPGFRAGLAVSAGAAVLILFSQLRRRRKNGN